MHPGENVDIDSLISAIPPFDEYRINGRFQSSGSKLPQSTFATGMESTPSECSDESEPEDLSHIALAEDLKKLHSLATVNRYFGPASAFMFLRHVTIIRSQITGENFTGPDPKKYRRHIYWEARSWEMSFVTSSELETCYVFPDDDLLQELVALYFEKTNTLIPVLHRPSFMKLLSVGQHRWDPSFGMIVLLVCAIGARYSRDPRVAVPDDDSGLSAGWQYFSQVPVHRKMMLFRTTIHDLQYYCLAPIYLLGTGIPHVGWILVGVGLRLAVEKGAHRRHGANRSPSAETELQKRAFWGLICLDRVGSAFFGRPLGFPDETIDVEYPIECDDEYWDAEEPFRQPEGKPSLVTAFIHFIKICEIMGNVLKTLYSEKKSKFLPSFVGKEWEEKVITELDSSMNKWKNNLPDHLQWDPDRKDADFFHQSVNLHCMYHYVQMQIHRPALLKKSPLGFSSLTMCSIAARSCARVVEAGLRRGLRILPCTLVSTFTAGVVIILGLWGGPSLGYVGNAEEDTECLHKCANVLKGTEDRWHCSGRLCDMLNEAASMTEYKPSQRRDMSEADDISIPQIPMSNLNLDKVPQPTVKDNAYIFEDNNGSTMKGWDLQRLLLSEMGYLPGNIMEGIEEIPVSTGYADQFAHAGVASGVSGVPHISPEASIAGLWNGHSNSSQWLSQEWSAYFDSMSQS
ncbi:putative transcriptional regulatory protein [Psilocybe cubensis]|uniref:Xylanolytic transcriptional activator regulatory domain-containing protein n=2 Tax=Psilocybe cubensis TaxID=181762 RepID=A0A8H8CK29_PSICU|nr:putative transcriptional regulatory protein [Psilocybe cubensis]KAH9478723.1 putative transcriptional regulatory protein [Psilocybe cubensis]